jgi:uncharacterized protein YqiB (DUF1249 family)
MTVTTQSVDSLAPSSWRARPRSFVALMSLYESNYLRLRALAGDLQRIEGAARSRVAGDCELVLMLRERSTHTSTFALTYLLVTEAAGFASPGVERVPDLELRVYHDARLCEALPAPVGSARIVDPAAACRAERELGQRWSRNMMLNKWLDYCLERGHSIGEAMSWARDQAAQAESHRGRPPGAAARRL